MAQVFASLVAMQDSGGFVFTERIEHGGERELAGVPRAEPPADDPSSFEIEHDRKVVLFTFEAEMGEILHPGARVRHVPVTLSGLWLRFVMKYCKTL